MALRSMTKRLVEAAIGREVMTIDPNAIVLIDARQRRHAWFCYGAQLQWFLEANRIDLVIDVGANEGQFARQLRRIYDGDIISFEPVSHAFSRLAAVAYGDPRWTVHQIALGSVDTTATMHVCSDTAFSSLLTSNEFSRTRFRGSAVVSDESVHVRRLDAVLAEGVSGIADRRIFLKLDTQGCDLDAFRGLGALVRSVRVLQAEVSLVPIYHDMPHWTTSIEAYEQAGFSVAGLFPVTRTKTGRVIEYDCVLLRDGEQPADESDG